MELTMWRPWGSPSGGIEGSYDDPWVFHLGRSHSDTWRSQLGSSDSPLFWNGCPDWALKSPRWDAILPSSSSRMGPPSWVLQGSRMAPQRIHNGTPSCPSQAGAFRVQSVTPLPQVGTFKVQNGESRMELPFQVGA